MGLKTSLLFAAALFAAPAAIANPDAQTDGTIVVEGERITREEMKSDARAMIRQLAVTPWADQYARWNTAICPKLIGITHAEAARVVSAKIRAVAAEAGVEVAPEGCRSNIVIAFTGDAKTLFRQVAARRNQMFDFIMPQEAEALRKSDLPVRWWYGLQTGGTQGHFLAGAQLSPGGIGVPIDGGPTIALYNGGSLVYPPVQASVINAAIIVDVKLAEGTRLDALAAYIAMVALAPSRMPPRPLPVLSIANLFQGGARQTDLTDWDRAYLEALYNGGNQRTTFNQRGIMVGRMADRIAGR